jgi:hypothetical protein
MAAWTYSQLTGQLCDPKGACVAVGYSGSEPYKNRPKAEHRQDEGPIPTGSYAIGEPRDDDQMGPFVLPLEPAPDNEMHDRFGFYFHGDTTPPGDASSGCIIVPRNIRDMIDASDCKTLIVTV